ncbi:MAG: glutathione transport system ATP-binding protein [Saliniramus fredricksonii]|uniref:Glutathione import ATP-binding protein GsiA n=1 Tax=Saliniramus fredricksonii TaxID=1653334 RepID=A0A0P8A412_9HYPH|nr:ABC transporter ATP-binding protein [Saliniramus fredricksonii]KPQ12264.1 MAG: glutathione transport system ATP-binding protein [Saliniramus fredricksonii]SCC78970.1 glutathione transport system ATP-binding protein [Saliniramus fredricksonii]
MNHVDRKIGTAPLLDVRSLTTVFPSVDGDVVAVDDVSFQIRPGETVALVGESGSGKSVTARSIMRLIDFMGGEIRKGEVRLCVDGQTRDLVGLPESQMRRLRGNMVSMIFQEPMTSLNPVLGIGQQITEVIRLHQGVGEKEARRIALKTLKLVRIPEAEKRLAQFPHELSGGMRQRVMIAIALACRPALLIADEPTTALDVTIQAQILQLIRSLQAEIGMAVLFITHDMGVVAEVADRVVVMYHGRKVEDGPTQEVFAAPRHNYTRALLSAIPRLGSMAGKPAPEPFAVLDPANAQSLARPLGALPAATHNKRRTRVLEVHKLTTRFPVRKGILRHITGMVHAVEEVSFSLHEGETLALVGESGCGKSTCGRSIMKLVEPTAGDIIIEGQNVTALSPNLMLPFRSRIQMIFQDPYASLNPRMTVEDILLEPLMIHRRLMPLKPVERAARIDMLLDRVGLPRSSRRRYPHEFSGGQRQRIAIARALMLNPRIIVADEAVSALDVSIQAQVVNLLLELQAELGIALIFISHDMAVVERISHRVAVMYLGQIVEIGPREAVFRNPAHAYTRRLLDSVPVADPTRQRERALDHSEIPSPVRPLGDPPVVHPLIEIGHEHYLQMS